MANYIVKVKGQDILLHEDGIVACSWLVANICHSVYDLSAAQYMSSYTSKLASYVLLLIA